MNLALFDFDGTLTTRDVYPGFLTFCSPRWRVMLGWALLALPYLGMKRGWVSPKGMRLVAAWVTFFGANRARVYAAGERYARDVLPGLLRPEAMARLAWHQAQGDRIVVVSGSMDCYLAPWCRAHGVELLCNQPAAWGERLSGFLAGVDCAGEGKAKRVRAHCDLARYPLVYAYGDTAEDDALLALAQRRWFRGEELPAVA